MFGFRRNCFIPDRSRLFLIRFSIIDRGIFVALRIFGMIKPAAIMSRNRLVTISLFLSWLRSSSQFRMRIFSDVSRDAILVSSSNFSSTDKACDRFRSKVSTTLEETLFTFCPPAPELLTALNCNSDMSLSFSNFTVAGAPILISH